jgi:DNA topoisomerase VI subunit A
MRYGYGAQPGSFKYTKLAGVTDDVPWVLEAAFAHCPQSDSRVLLTGCNFTPSLGETFQGLDAELEFLRVNDKDPVLVGVHLVYPAADFIDRGKTRLKLPSDITNAVEIAVANVTKAWTKQRKAEERSASARARRDDVMSRRKKVDLTQAAAEIMEEAYLIASAQGTLPANARQIYYAARAYILKRTGRDTFGAQYFTQTLLINFMRNNAELTADWDVVFDDRGHFIEPHTKYGIGLGTIAVREYINNYCKEAAIIGAALKDAHIATKGPLGRFKGLLYIEKEGFTQILQAVQLAERFDIAIMSSKGMQVTAARKLAEAICSKYDIPLYVLHDFDKSGMSIAALSKRSNPRFTYTQKFKVIDLGFRLTDVEALNLLGSAEPHSDTGSREARAKNLRKNGATEEEVEFLLDRRVELNALPSDRFVAYVERKLIEHGAHKVVPSKRLLAQTYRAFARNELAKPLVAKVLAETAAASVAVPANLKERVEALLKAKPAISWDQAVTAIVRGKPE